MEPAPSVTDIETIEQRLSAVERALTEGDDAFETLEDAGELGERLTTVEEQLEDIETQLAEVDAATQALRGYVGNVRSVNQDIERRAETALAKVEQLEARQRDPDHPDDGQPHRHEAGERQPSRDETDQHERSAHTCDACGQATSGTPKAAEPDTGQTPQTDECESDRRADESATEWARSVGSDRGTGTDATARTDGGRGTRRQDAARTTGRDRDTPQSPPPDECDDTGLVATLRDVL